MTAHLVHPSLSPQSRKKTRDEKKPVHSLVSSLTLYDFRLTVVKLPAPRAGLPEKEVSFILYPLTPPTRRRLRGTVGSKAGGKRRWGFRSETWHLISKPRLITEVRSKKFSFLIIRGSGLSFFSIPPISPLSDRLRWRQLPSNIPPSENWGPRY